MSEKKLLFLPLFVAGPLGENIATAVFGLNRFVATLLLATFLYFLYGYYDLTRGDVGTLKVTKKAYLWSAAIFGLVLLVLGLAYLVSPNVFLDQRYDQSLKTTLISVFIALPITTVILEEFIFRGILLGYLLKHGSQKSALVISSIMFGLWHISSSFYVHVDGFLFIKRPPQLLITLAIILITSAAGWIFSLLRLKSRSILVPIVAHWSLNALGILFAWLAWQR